MHTCINPQSVLDTFVAYTGRAPKDNDWDTRLLQQVEEAMTQLLSPDGLVYSHAEAAQKTDLDRTYRTDIRQAMRDAGFVGQEPDTHRRNRRRKMSDRMHARRAFKGDVMRAHALQHAGAAAQAAADYRRKAEMTDDSERIAIYTDMADRLARLASVLIDAWGSDESP